MSGLHESPSSDFAAGEIGAVRADGRTSESGFGVDAILVGLFLAITSAVGLWARGRWLDPIGDPGFSWSLVHRVAHGEAPYRDILLSYTPLSAQALAFAARVFGDSARFWVLANWVPAILVGVLLIIVARRHLDPLERITVAAVFMALSLFVSGDARLVFPYYPGVVHASLFSLGALLFLHEGRWSIERRAFCAAVLAGLAFGCKQEVGVAAFAGIAAPILTDPKRAVRWCLFAAAGAAIAIAIPFALAMPLPPLASLAGDNRLWPLAFKPPSDQGRLFRAAAGIQDPGWPRAVASSAVHMMLKCLLILLAATLAFRPRTWKSGIPLAWALLATGVAWILLGADFSSPLSPVCLSVLVSVAVAAIAFFRRTLSGRTFLVGLGVFAALAGLRTVFSPLTTLAFNGPARIGASLTWVVFLCVLLPELFVPFGRARRLARRMMAAALLIAAVPPALDGMKSLRFDDRLPFETRRGTVFVNRSQARVLALLSRSLRPGERALPIPESNGVDPLFDVRVVSPLIDLMPGWVDARMDRALVERFERNPPDVVILFDRALGEYGLRPFGEGYGRALAQWCDSRYVLVDECPGVRVLRPRRGAGGSRQLPAVSGPPPPL